ncbi:unnamed protein product [Caenorhabditis sp. 36 PRJEB53466]|nr:unnamed protein product [Caenorhabditis sp. 36 PRJEB53466]
MLDFLDVAQNGFAITIAILVILKAVKYLKSGPKLIKIQTEGIVPEHSEKIDLLDTIDDICEMNRWIGRRKRQRNKKSLRVLEKWVAKK